MKPFGKRESGTRTLKALSGGLVAAVFTVILLSFLPRYKDLDVLAAMLIGAGALYFGSALTDGRQKILLLEAAVGVLIIVMSLMGQWYSPAIMAAGYLLHGVWDYCHHPLHVGAKVTATWFSETCLSYDWLIAAFIMFKYVVRA